jgi:LPXTG-motif cell wall-anchored protein
MITFIALRNKADIMAPKHIADSNFFIFLGFIILITVLGAYLKYKKEKQQQKQR